MKQTKKILPDDFNIFRFGRTETGTPLVDEYFGQNKWISWGIRNDYPNELIRLYNNSDPIHQAIINKKAAMIAGLGFKDNPALAEFINNEFSCENLNVVASKTAFDLVLVGAFALNIIYNQDGTRIARIEHIPIQKVRCQKPNDVHEDVNTYLISNDWLKIRREENKPYELAAFNPENAKRFPSQLFFYRSPTASVGLDYYTNAPYSSTVNWLKLSWEISQFHLKNVQNGLMPGMIIVNKMGIPSKNEREALYNEIKSRYAGADNAGDFIMVFAENKDKAPEFIPVELNATDQRFKDLMVQINQNIYAGHGATSVIAGVETSGKLGGRTEIEQQYALFQSTVISPLQKIMTDTFSKLASFNGINERFELNEYKAFPDILKGKNNDVANALSLLNPLVANKVLEVMDKNEVRAILGLPPVEAQSPGTGATSTTLSGNDIEVQHDLDKEAKARLKGTVGGVQGILAIKKAVDDGTSDFESAVQMIEILYGYSKEEAQLIIGKRVLN